MYCPGAQDESSNPNKLTVHAATHATTETTFGLSTCSEVLQAIVSIFSKLLDGFILQNLTIILILLAAQ